MPVVVQITVCVNFLKPRLMEIFYSKVEPSTDLFNTNGFIAVHSPEKIKQSITKPSGKRDWKSLL